MIGKTISHYRITEKLGEGGMGVVYRAEDTTLKRAVAVKFLPPGVRAHEPERARLLQEAQAAAALNHPNICTIHHIQEYEDSAGEGTRQFIVMEYVDGKTLEQLVPVRKLQDAIRYAIQIGEALQEAHAAGIVHRDIKTDNIMVNSRNEVKVMDFGLAKLKGSLKLTKTSSTVGTLAYMSPEQIEGGEVDARSDIFSFGVVLYQMLTGRMPFRGEHEAAMVYSIVNEDPTPAQKYLPDIPSELVHILNRALEKEPGDRYQNVSEMVIDLRRLKKQSGRVPSAGRAAAPPDARRETATAMPGPAPGAPKRRALWISAAGVLLVALAAAAAFLLSRGPQFNPEMTFRIVQVPFQNVGYACISADGNWVYFPAEDENGKFDVYMMNMTGGAPRRITNDSCDGIFSVSISPDASTILYGRSDTKGMRSEIVSVPTLGGTGRVIIENGSGQDWRPDGKRIGYLASRELPGGRRAIEFWSAAPDGSDRRCEVADTVIRRPGLRRGYWWSPDGRSITWVRNFPEGHIELFIHNLETGSERQLTFDRKIAEDGLWSPTGHIIYSSNRTGNFNLWMVPVSGGTPVQLTRGSGPDTPAWISADGKKLVYAERQQIGQIKVANLDSRSLRQLTVEDRERGYPAISQDGKAILFPEQEGDALSSRMNIYLVDEQGKNVRKLTDDSTFKSSPAWSPDMKWVAYCSQPTDEPPDSTGVFLLQADRPGRPRLVGKGSAPTWFSDSQLVVWNAPNSYLVSVNREGYEKISEDSIWACPVLDGKSVLLWDSHANARGISITSFTRGRLAGTTGARQLLKTSPLVFRIAQKAQELFYVARGSLELRRVSLRDGTDRPAGMKLPGLEKVFDVRSDGKEIVYTDLFSRIRLVVIDNLFE